MGTKNDRKNVRELEEKVKSLEKTCAMLMDKVEFYQDSLGENYIAFEKNYQLNKKLVSNQSQVETVTKLLSAERDKLNHILCSLPGVLLILDKQGVVQEVYRGIDFPILVPKKQQTISQTYGDDFEKELAEKIRSQDFLRRGLVNFCHQIHSSSKPLWMNVGIFALRGESIVMSLRDVTKEKLIQQEYREQEAHVIQSGKLASLGEMAGGIAHEINNPLTVLASRSEYLIQKIQSDKIDQEKTLENLFIIKKMVNRITQITLSMRRLSRDTKNEPKSSVLIGDIVNDLKGICSEKFRVSGIKLIFNIDCIFETKKISVFQGQISQVLINLLNNACDAVEACEEKVVEVQIETYHKDGVRLTVRDSGPGVPDNIKDKIFTPFFTTKEVGKGTGLGLGLSKTIIEKHSGQFYLNKDDPMTAFVIELPNSLAG